MKQRLQSDEVNVQVPIILSHSPVNGSSYEVLQSLMHLQLLLCVDGRVNCKIAFEEGGHTRCRLAVLPLEA